MPYLADWTLSVRDNSKPLALNLSLSEEGAAAANDITQEFLEDRTWHNNVLCSWDGESLTLEAYNDYDSDGLALMDEFSDCISAYVKEHFDGAISMVFVRTCS